MNFLIMASSNPFVPKITAILNDIKGWFLALVAVVTVVVILIHAFKYFQGDGSEKAEAMSNIKKTVYMGGGVFFLIWFATYVVDKMKV
ncbi:MULTISPECIES: hypothetical protein [unclassified Clostridium]|uniref:hypothetical protein n=1 Tax=unclassified Clostridium TaxID=2614128 RepID=UPI000EDD5A56|nr:MULTISPECIES: hypothetical protein [unclassified Clostridium]HCQ91312.1 hypothetical protein [Clostridium sp.]